MEINPNQTSVSINSYLQTAKSVQPIGSRGITSTRLPESNPAKSFGSILDGAVAKQSEVKFSKHAEQRMNARGIAFTGAEKERLMNAVDRAKEKGLRDSLIMLDDVAMVVNVSSRTVVTAVVQDQLKDNVFSNIDGAVFG